MSKKRPDGRYEKLVTLNGKQIHFYGKTLNEVNRKINAYREAQVEGPLFLDVAKEWYEQKAEEIAYNTTKGYKPAVERAIEWFGNKRIREIEPHEIAKEIKEFSRTYADKTVRTQLLVLNLIFKYAVEHGYCQANAARDLSVPSGLAKRKVDAPSDEDIERVKASVNCTFGLFAYMAMYTGMRKGELLALEWKDIDLDARVIHISKSLYHDSNRPMVKAPKTEESANDVPILDSLMAVLPHRRSGLVFPNDKGEYLSETQYQRQWELYTRESGVTCTPHQLRHQFATALYNANVPAEKAMLLLRHRQISTTMGVYTTIKDAKRNEVFSSIYDLKM